MKSQFQDEEKLPNPHKLTMPDKEGKTEWLWATMSSIGDAVIATDTENRVTFMNPAAESLTGWTAQEGLGEPLDTVFRIINETTGRPIENPAENALRKRTAVGLPNRSVLIAKDGARIAIDDTTAPIHAEDGTISGAVLVFRDVTPKRLAEQRRNARLAVTQILATETSVEHAIPEVLSAICSALGWDVASFWRFVPERNRLECRECWTHPALNLDAFSKATRELSFALGESLPGAAWKRQQPVWVPDLASDPAFRRAPQARDVGLHGGFACPIATGRSFLGILECFSREIQEPDEDLLEMMATVSGQIGQYLERRKAEEKLRQSEEMLADFFDNATIGLHWVGPDGKILRVNQAELDLLGYAREEYLGHHIAEFHVDREAIEDILRRLKSREPLQSYEARLRSKDGSIRDVLIDSSVLWDGDRFIHTRCFTRDITKRKKAENALRESEERFRILADAAPVLIWMSGPNKEGIYFNQTWLDFTGQPMETQQGEGWLDRVHPDDREPLFRICSEGFKNRTPFTAEFRLLRADGEYRWLLDSGVPRFDAEGRFGGFIGSCVDITERKQAEESQALLAAIVTSSDDAIMTKTPEGIITSWNAGAERIFGYPAEEIIGKPITLIIPPELHDEEQEFLERISRGEPITSFETVRVSKEGRRIDISVTVSPLRDARGSIVGASKVIRDITKRKRLEQSLKFLAEASRTLSTLIDYKNTLQKVARLAVPDFADWCAVDMRDTAGEIQRVAVAHIDPAKIRLAEELFTKYPPDPESPKGTMKVLRTGEPDLAVSITEEMLERSARDEDQLRLLRELNPTSYMCVPLETTGTPFGVMIFVSAESGRQYGPDDLAHAEDLAHRAAVAIENARLYHEVQRADRRKDEFLAMLAHELRNPLAPIRSGLDILSMDPGIDQDMIKIMQGQVSHVVRLVDDLLDVSRIMRGKIELRKQPVQLSALIQQSVEAIRPLMESNQQELVVSLPEQSIWLDADPVRLLQVFENLLTNSSKYTEPGGCIDLIVEVRNGQAVILVRDTGIGIEPELLPTVFDLFTQSTRTLDRAKGGLGIGLTLVRRLVELHEGSVTAQSEGPGQGSTFTVRLPVNDQPPLIREEPEPAGALEARRILVVDDNEGAAFLLSKLLEKIGKHEVSIAHDGISALAKLQEVHPDLVLLDIGLPGMNGYEVAGLIRDMPQFDEVLLVALTGYGQKEDREKSKNAGFDEHQVKPPSLEQLKAILAHPKLKQRKRGRHQPLAPAGKRKRSSRQPPLSPADNCPLEKATANGSADVDLKKLKHDLGNVGYVLSLIGEMFMNPNADAQLVTRAREALKQETDAIHRLVKMLQNAIERREP